MGRKRKAIVKRVEGSPFWYYDWTVQGHRFRGSTETSDEGLAVEIALEERRKALRRIRLDEAIQDGRAEITLDQALARCTKEHWRYYPAQLAAIPHHCRPLLRIMGADTLLSEIDDSVAADFVARRRGETVKRRGKPKKGSPPPKLVSAATVNHSLKALRTAMGRAGKWKVDGKPVAVGQVEWAKHKLPETALETFLTYDQAESLIAALVPHARAPVRLALYTGLRRGNVLGLGWRDVDLAAARLVLPIKGGKMHSVDLIPEAAALLEDLAPNPLDRHGPVFTFGNPEVGCACVCCRAGNQVNRRLQDQPIKSIKRAYATARKGMGQPRLRFHDLRHTVASWLLQNGHSLKTVQQVLGHADIATTARYAHLEHGALRAAMSESLGRRG